MSRLYDAVDELMSDAESVMLALQEKADAARVNLVDAPPNQEEHLRELRDFFEQHATKLNLALSACAAELEELA